MNIDAAQGWSLIITTAASAFGTFYSLVRIKRNTLEVVKAKEAAQEVKAAVVETKQEIVQVKGAVVETKLAVVEVKQATVEIHDLTNSNYTLQKAEISELKSMLATAQGVAQAAELTRVTLAKEAAAAPPAPVPAPPVEESPPLIIHPPGS